MVSKLLTGAATAALLGCSGVTGEGSVPFVLPQGVDVENVYVVEPQLAPEPREPRISDDYVVVAEPGLLEPAQLAMQRWRAATGLYHRVVAWEDLGDAQYYVPIEWGPDRNMFVYDAQNPLSAEYASAITLTHVVDGVATANRIVVSGEMSGSVLQSAIAHEIGHLLDFTGTHAPEPGSLMYKAMQSAKESLITAVDLSIICSSAPCERQVPEEKTP